MYKTVMVTGATGYLGSWTVKELLEHGYTTRVCVRNKGDKERRKHLEEIALKSPGRIEIFEADLLKAGSFDEAARGSDAIFHMASPFSLRFKDPKRNLLDPALEGTRNVLQAATDSGTVKKVVLTSSVVAVYGDNIDMQEQGLSEFTEEHFTSTSSLHHQPYSYSKVMAEKEAWKIADSQDQWKLVVLNPAFVMGPALSIYSDSESLDFMKNILSGKYHMGAPHLMFSFVDVRDVARAHRLALENENLQGRCILSVTCLAMMELSELIKKKYGKRFRLPLMKAPKFLMYLTGAMFGITWKFTARNIGYPLRISNTKSIEQLGMEYTPFEKTIADMVAQMVAMKMVKD